MIERTLRTDTVLVCAISFWEIAALERRGRLALSVPVRAFRGEVLEMGIRERAVDGDLGIAAALLDWQHKDPADRLIAATTESSQGRLTTADRDLLEWAGPRRSIDARK
jgi:PIN domain nuclease of toxin-antitoxin system